MLRKALKYFSAVIIIIIVSAYYMTNSSTVQNPAAQNKYKYLALGDSYTIGESVDEQERFPVQLVNQLRGENINISDLIIIAKTGWTTDELIGAIKEKNIKDTFDVVTLLIGVNNQYRGRSSEEYRAELIQLIDIAVNYTGGNKNRVFVLSIPDWGITPFAEGRDRNKIAGEIDEYNRVKKEETEKAGIKYYDITGISRMNDPLLVAADGLHPSGAQYTKWVEKIYSDVKNILSN